jgi:hypothetical protein
MYGAWTESIHRGGRIINSSMVAAAMEGHIVSMRTESAHPQFEGQTHYADQLSDLGWHVYVKDMLLRHLS